MRVLRFLLPLLALAGACRPSPRQPAADPRTWDGFVDEFLEAHFAANPGFAVYQGRHEYDGKLPDWSEAGLRREAARLRAARDSAAAWDTTGLDPRQRLQRRYLVAVLEGQLFWLDDAKWPWKNPTWYARNLDPNVYIARPYANPTVRARALTAWARAIPGAAREIQANLHTPLPKSYVAIGRIRFGGLVSFLRTDAPKAFTEVKDSAVLDGLHVAIDSAADALARLDGWFASQQQTAIDSFAMGPELFARMLMATDRVEVPLERLEALGRADLKRNLAALQEACTVFALRQTLRACVAKANALKPKGSVVEAARLQLDSLSAFVRAHDLVSVPGNEKAEVRESPPYQRWNFAYIDPPGPYDKGLPSVYYVAPPDPSWSPEERADYLPGRADLEFTSVHEVWPGHFLQFLHSNRSADKFGAVFVTYAFAEGWAHYAEEMMWEAGLGEGSPEVHIGQLQNALLRDARYLSAIGMQTRGMTPAQSERLFREEALQDAATARQQAARGTFDPEYLNYTLGKLMIRQLREDWTASRGRRSAWKAFHDQFLSYGGPPVPLVRDEMLGREAGPALR
jgi:Bacterial protein of unknown function (DUF885)